MYGGNKKLEPEYFENEELRVLRGITRASNELLNQVGALKIKNRVWRGYHIFFYK